MKLWVKVKHEWKLVNVDEGKLSKAEMEYVDSIASYRYDIATSNDGKHVVSAYAKEIGGSAVDSTEREVIQLIKEQVCKFTTRWIE